MYGCTVHNKILNQSSVINTFKIFTIILVVTPAHVMFCYRPTRPHNKERKNYLALAEIGLETPDVVQILRKEIRWKKK